MSKSRRRRPSRELFEADLIPVLSCMFLLIPALLLAMEVAPFRAVAVRPPHFTRSLTDEDPTGKDDVVVRVTIREDGLRAELRRSGAPGPDIREFPSTDGAPDYAALRAFAVAFKRDFPTNNRVELTAEADIPLSTLVRTMDVLRGEDCSLVDAMRDGGDDSEACLLWQVTVTS